MPLFLGSDVLKALAGNLLILLYQGLGYDELLNAVLPRILEGLLAHHAMAGHGLSHLESRVYEDAIIASEHLGIHPSH